MFTNIVDRGNPKAEKLKMYSRYRILDPIVAPKTRAI